jgi:uncharacterized secreted repeat protein (TIGR03808 family)
LALHHKEIPMTDRKPNLDRRRWLTGAGSAAAAIATAGCADFAGEGGRGSYAQYAEITPGGGGTPGAVGGQDALNVRALGAVGNGRSDDTRAFARAIRAARSRGGIIFVPPGTYRVGELESPGKVTWVGVPGASVLLHNGGAFLMSVTGVSDVVFQDLTFDGNRGARSNDALVLVRGAKRVRFEGCTIQRGSTSGISIEDAACTVTGCVIRNVGLFGIVCNTQDKVQIVGNEIVDIGNKGVYAYRPRRQTVQLIIADNFIARIRADAGGDGPYGNAVNIFRADNALVESNHISDCKFSGVRVAESSGCRIIGNHFTRVTDTVIYIEFGASRTIISSNHILDCPHRAIGITNFDHGGHLHVCTSNVIKNTGYEAIFAEADTIIQSNIIDGADHGIVVGYGPFTRNVTVDGNIIQDTRSGSSRRLRYGVLVSNDKGAKPAFVTNNRIFNFRDKAIYGHDHRKPRPLGANVYLAHNYPGVNSGDLPRRAIGGSVNYEPDTGRQSTFGRGGWRSS